MSKLTDFLADKHNKFHHVWEVESLLPAHDAEIHERAKAELFDQLLGQKRWTPIEGAPGGEAMSMDERLLRSQLADAALAWAQADVIVRAETKSFRDLIGTCEFYEEPADVSSGYPGRDGVETCWRRVDWHDHDYPGEICGACAAHGDRRKIRWAAMARRQGAARRMRNLAAKISEVGHGA